MTTKTLALDPGGPERLVISWTGAWRDLSASIDGIPLFTRLDPATLRQGPCARLPDGRQLQLFLDGGVFGSTLRVLVDGMDLEPPPKVRWRLEIPAAALFVVALLALGACASFIVGGHRDSRVGLLGLLSGVYPVILAALALAIRKGSRLAASTAAMLYGLDNLVYLTGVVGGIFVPSFGHAMVRLLLFVTVLSSVSATFRFHYEREFRQARERESAQDLLSVPESQETLPGRPRLRRVVSGGQTGVDQAALRAARKVGLPIGGWCSPGRTSEDGQIPDDLPLAETPRERSQRAPHVPRSLRTEWNVRDSDATLVLSPASLDPRDDPGTAWTLETAAHQGRPLLAVDPFASDAARHIAEWLHQYEVEVLNVAGPSEAAWTGVGDATETLFLEALRLYNPLPEGLRWSG